MSYWDGSNSTCDLVCFIVEYARHEILERLRTVKRKRHKIVIVYWLDAFGTETHEECNGVLQISAGVLVSQNKERVQLAQIADCDGEAEPFRDVLTIPAGMVVEMILLDVPAVVGVKPVRQPRPKKVPGIEPT